MKSIPFRSIVLIPGEVRVGTVLTFQDVSAEVTKIKSVKFVDKETVEVTGLCKTADKEVFD